MRVDLQIHFGGGHCSWRVCGWVGGGRGLLDWLGWLGWLGWLLGLSGLGLVMVLGLSAELCTGLGLGLGLGSGNSSGYGNIGSFAHGRWISFGHGRWITFGHGRCSGELLRGEFFAHSGGLLSLTFALGINGKLWVGS